jgi:two-component system sensor histidine kinase CiaH
MLTIKLEDSSNRYVQLMINIDTELELINHYSEIIAVAIICGIIASIFASYFLSKRTLKPLETTLKNQMEFVQNVSHELRTPLTIIQAKQELLLQEPNSKIIDKSEDILLTLNETKRLSKMTKDLMMLARADDNRMTLEKEKVNIDTLIQDVLKPYEEVVELDKKKLIVDLKYDDTVSIDTSKIYQVLVILLDNALKYTEAKDTITVKSYEKDNKCFIEVQDTGIGISDEAISHVFERFYREDKSRTRSTGGSGLGLSIADAIIRAHGGTIKVSHNGEKGTIFTIKLNK